MQKLPKKVCNTCHQEKLLIEYTLYSRTAKYAPRCKECVKLLNQTKPNEYERMRRNTSQGERFIHQYFPDKHKRRNKPDIGRAADGSCYNF